MTFAPSAVWLKPHESLQVRTASIPEPSQSPELWEMIIPNCCCFKSPSFTLICDTTIDNWNIQQTIFISKPKPLRMSFYTWNYISPIFTYQKPTCCSKTSSMLVFSSIKSFLIIMFNGDLLFLCTQDTLHNIFMINRSFGSTPFPTDIL